MAPWMALFPPGKGGGEGVARGGKGKGILIHSLTESHGMPLANCTTPAHRDERAQVLPLLDAVKVHIGTRGHPRQRLKAIATDKGYDAKAHRQKLRQRGIRAQIPKRVWKTKKNRGRAIKKVVPRFQAERTFAWFQKKYRRLVVRPTGRLDPTPADLAYGSLELAALEYRARRGEIILLYEGETILWRFALPHAGWWRRAQRYRLPTRPLSQSQITREESLKRHARGRYRSWSRITSGVLLSVLGAVQYPYSAT
jgi:hypothetical protein